MKCSIMKKARLSDSSNKWEHSAGPTSTIYCSHLTIEVLLKNSQKILSILVTYSYPTVQDMIFDVLLMCVSDLSDLQ